MPANTDEVIGPIDFLLLEFDADKMTGQAAAALIDLIDAGIIRLYDLLLIQKHDGDAYEALELTDLPATVQEGFGPLAGARSGLISEDDIAEAASVMEPGRVAALLIYENAWAVPFVAAAREAEAQVIATERIPAAVVMETLDALEAAEA